MTSWASLADRIFKKEEKCEKLIKYQDRSFEFKGVGAEIPGFKFSFKGFNTEPKVLQEATEAAKALDDLQYLLCQNLSRKSVTELLDKEVLRRYAKARMSSFFLFSSFRVALEAFKNDQEAERDNLKKSIEDIRYFTSSLAREDLAAPRGLSSSGRDAISSALKAAEVDEEELDRVLLDRFAEFEKTQREILERVKQVQKAFYKQVTELNLSTTNVKLITAETTSTKGETDSWTKGHFRDGDIMNGYDARRPKITDKIIGSIENNTGTILYGKPHYGKTMILKRVMFEQIEKGGGYAIIFCDNVDSNANHLIRLLQKVSASSSKLLVIVDNAHRKGSEEMFVAFNNLRDGDSEDDYHHNSSDYVRFLFAAREAELKTMIKNLRDRDKANEVKDAVRKLERNKITLDFDIDDALLFVEKALAVVKPRQINNNSKEDAKNLAEYWYYQVSKHDPFVFVLALMRYLSKDVIESEDFIESEMDEKINSLTGERDVRAALLCSFMGAFGIRVSSEFVESCGFYEDSLTSLVGSSILFKDEEEYYTIRHELWALEFVLHFYSKKCNNSYSAFDNTYRIGDIIRCVLNNASINELLDILSRTADLCKDQRFQRLGKVIIDNFVVPVLDRLDDAGVLSNIGYALNNMGRYSEALEYVKKALTVNPDDCNSLNIAGYALNKLGRYEDALNHYNKVLAIDSKNPYALEGKAISLNKLGRSEEMSEDDKKASTVAQEVTAGYALNATGRYSEALEYVKKALTVNPDDCNFLNIAGYALNATGRYSEALEYVKKALTVNPDDCNSLNIAGYALNKLGRYEDALNHYNKVLAIDSKNPYALEGSAVAWYNIACSRVKEGDTENALAHLEKAIKIHPKYIESAREGKDFESISNDERFKALVMK